MPSLSILKTTTRAALLGTTALVVMASGAQAVPYIVSTEETSTRIIGTGLADTLTISGAGEINTVSPGVAVIGAADSITILDTTGAGPEIDATSVGIEIEGAGDLSGGITIAADAIVTAATTAGAGTAGTGILVKLGGGISGGINNSGAIMGAGNGVRVADSASISGGIINAGFIYGDDAAISIGDNATASATMGAITNNVGGVIGVTAALTAGPTFALAVGTAVAKVGIQVAGSGSTVGLITNHGEIVGSSSGTAISVASGGDISGGIVNTGTIGIAATSGTITSAQVGISVAGTSSDISGLIDNDGVIFGTSAAISVGGGDISGGIDNDGVIGANALVGATAFAHTGIIVNSSGSISGGITNSGGIFAGSSTGDVAIKVGAGTLGSTANVGINNSGTIAGYAAIDITSGSTVYGITNTGEIFRTGGTGAAISAVNSQFNGNIANNTGGLIGVTLTGASGNSTGISFNNTDSTHGITNNGVIVGDAKAISITNGSELTGAIANSTAGVIGYYAPGTNKATTGIFIDNSTVTGGISNSGKIVGSANSILLDNSSSVGSLTNNLGGVIAATATAILVQGGSRITGVLSNVGTIGNATTGVSTAAKGIVVTGLSSDIVGGVNNSGTIKGLTAAIEVASSGEISGGIINSSVLGGSATIDGIHVNGGSVGTSSAAFGISNTGTGTIIGTNAGVLVDAGGSILADIENAGTIYGANVGISVLTGGDINGITNSGLIGATSGGAYANTAAILVNGATSNISGAIINTGTIRSDIDAISLTGSGRITGGIANGVNGTIQGDGGDAISIGAGSVVGSVTGTGISNATNGTILGTANGIDIDGSVLGGISNNGTLTGTNNSGINIAAVGSVTGGIDNSASGSINGSSHGINVSGSVTGGITNSGLIVGVTGDAILVTGAAGSVIGGIVNNASAIISGSSTSGNGIGITGGASVSGGISNSGTIYSNEESGILIDDSSLSGNITNASGADITGDTVAISVSNSTVTGSIVNTGDIRASTTGIYLGTASTITGTITNNTGGVIYGDDYGIYLNSGSDVTGGIVNDGVIRTETSATGGTAILITASSTVGSITNSGVIQGGTSSSGYGIYVSTGSSVGSITNSGTIEGDSGSIQFGNSDSTLTLQTGSNLIGGADGGTGTNDTLVLEGNGSENEVFTEFETLTVSASTSGTWVLSGASTVDNVTVNSGTLDIQGVFGIVSTATIAGGTLNVSSTGVLTVNTIAATGDLDVEGTIAATGGVTVDGTLSGSGTITGGLVTVNGILSPGNSPGQITLPSLLQTSGSTYLIEHDITSTSGFLTDTTDVTGAATIDTDVDINLVVGAGTDGFEDDILTAAGGITGTYDDINLLEDNLVALVAYPDANTATLLVAKTDALAATAATVSDAGFVFLDNLQEGARRDGRVWATAYIYSAENEGLGNNGADFDQDAFGFNAGVDVISQPNLKVGLAVGYIDGEIDIDSATSDADNDGIFGAAYLNYMNDNFYLDGAIMIGQQTVDTTRKLTAGDATASIDATSYGANLEAGFELEALGGRLSPFVKVGIHSASLDAYSESGAAGAMTVGEVETQQMRIGGGFRYAVDLGSEDGIQVTPAIKVGMTQEWQDGDSSADIGFVGYTGSTTASLDFEDQTTIDLGISFDVKLSQAVTAFVGWDAALGDETTRNTGTIGLSINW